MKKNQLMIAVLMSGSLLLSNCKKEKPGAVEPLLHASNLESTAGDVQAAAVLFNGDAGNGSENVWKSTNIEGTGAVSTVTDETGVLTWKFLKPLGSHRTEGHGAKNYLAAEGDEIYIGFTSKLLIPADLKTEAIFQWKSYPTVGSLQNHPLMLRTKGGKLELQHFDDSHVATVPWAITLPVNTWMSFVIRMKVSRNPAIGFIEFWYNGVKQTLANGTQRLTCRTLDVKDCDPKWGVYGGDEAAVTHYVKKIRIATTYADAAQ
ncbi:heparin lyase I family protein [Pedobacter sp. PLR]|uniref:heparin lyase I family protein n=1 Tax=Pedobacter sp. PLR TaxID=2994465 RepID=UPI0022483328|nr:heparin lyase I family protein [Pedobacter sp. PLR]MCX2450292.1 heparin lyase I family protein [Pedobacter sp. PLR]